MKIDILGTEYEIIETTEDEDAYLKDCDGYCDKTVKKIVVLKSKPSDSNLGDFDAYKSKVLRHEIIHAFMFESGLHENWEHPNKWGQDETTVDWFAVQFPKILSAFKAAGCI